MEKTYKYVELFMRGIDYSIVFLTSNLFWKLIEDKPLELKQLAYILLLLGFSNFMKQFKVNNNGK